MEDCPDNTYQKISGQEECVLHNAANGHYINEDDEEIICPGGYTCQGGDTQPVICPEGYMCTGGTSQPVICSPGFYANMPGMSMCDSCPAAKYCPGDGTVTPLDCGDNTYQHKI